METIEDCWGEKLSQIVIKPDNELTSLDNTIQADEIIFVFEKHKLQILPVVDTDELEITISERDSAERYEEYLEVEFLSKYIEKKLSVIWNCTNSNGYFDLFVIGFTLLHPNLLILSEGSVLKLFEASRI